MAKSESNRVNNNSDINITKEKIITIPITDAVHALWHYKIVCKHRKLPSKKCILSEIQCKPTWVAQECFLLLIVHFKLCSFSVKVTCGFLDTETMEEIVKLKQRNHPPY